MYDCPDAPYTQRPYIVDGADPDDVAYVIENMRESDIREGAVLGFEADDAAGVVSHSHDVYTAYLGNEPVFIFGTVDVVPGVRQLFGFGTDRTHRVIPHVTWFTTTYWLPDLFDLGVRRIQAHIPETSIASVRWLQSFGMFREASMAGYGVDGSTVLQLAFTKREYDLYVLDKLPTADRTADQRLPRPSEVILGDTAGSRSREEEETLLSNWFGFSGGDGWSR